MDKLFIIVVVATSSLLAQRITNRTYRANPSSIRLAVHALFEWIGLFACFLVLNIAVGAAIVFTIRVLTKQFVGLYVLENFFLVILSGAQGFVFQSLWNRYK